MTMAHTVKQVAAMSGVSVRTLHFYDETGLLKPAYLGANGYRFYEEAQLLILQQILFYRELGFELKQIKRILGRRGFEIAAALQSHRKVLQKNFTRTRTLIETVDKTIQHLKGKSMKTEEMFAGFSVAAGKDRFNEGFNRNGTTIDCKVSGKDTGGAMCVIEVNDSGWPRHLNPEQDEWIYVVEGEVELEIGKKRFHLCARESMFIPRNIEHAWGGVPAKILNAYQPAGKIEEFFQTLARFKDLPTREQAINKTYTDEQKNAMKRVFEAHGMILTGPPLSAESSSGRVTPRATDRKTTSPKEGGAT
jgi:DNA-binding transcriptional MerR regulator